MKKSKQQLLIIEAAVLVATLVMIPYRLRDQIFSSTSKQLLVGETYVDFVGDTYDRTLIAQMIAHYHGVFDVAAQTLQIQKMKRWQQEWSYDV